MSESKSIAGRTHGIEQGSKKGTKSAEDSGCPAGLSVRVALVIAVTLGVMVGCDDTTPVPPDTAPSFSDTVNDQTYTVGETVSLTLPSATGGNGPLTYSLQPTVPGLTFDVNTRELSGTPSVAGTYRTTYHVADADDNTDDSDATTQEFTITTLPPPAEPESTPVIAVPADLSRRRLWMDFRSTEVSACPREHR